MNFIRQGITFERTWFTSINSNNAIACSLSLSCALRVLPWASVYLRIMYFPVWSYAFTRNVQQNMMVLFFLPSCNFFAQKNARIQTIVVLPSSSNIQRIPGQNTLHVNAFYWVKPFARYYSRANKMGFCWLLWNQSKFRMANSSTCHFLCAGRSIATAFPAHRTRLRSRYLCRCKSLGSGNNCTIFWLPVALSRSHFTKYSTHCIRCMSRSGRACFTNISRELISACVLLHSERYRRIFCAARTHLICNYAKRSGKNTLPTTESVRRKSVFARNGYFWFWNLRGLTLAQRRWGWAERRHEESRWNTCTNWRAESWDPKWKWEFNVHECTEQFMFVCI